MKEPVEVIRSYPAHDGTLGSMFISRCTGRENEVFLRQGDVQLSWGEFGDLYKKLARALAVRGIRQGDRVALIGTNDVTHVLALFALGQLGAIMVPINPDLGIRELSYILGNADVQGIIAHAALEEVIGRSVSGAGGSPWLLTWGKDSMQRPDSLQLAMDSATGIEPKNVATPTDTCVIIYTSGTTGFPKGVMHSQRNFVLAGEANVARVHLQPEDRAMIILPFFHMNALFYSVGGVLAAGASMIIESKFSASRFWDTVADGGATVVNIIEAIGTILCARDRREYRQRPSSSSGLWSAQKIGSGLQGGVRRCSFILGLRHDRNTGRNLQPLPWA